MSNEYNYTLPEMDIVMAKALGVSQYDNGIHDHMERKKLQYEYADTRYLSTWEKIVFLKHAEYYYAMRSLENVDWSNNVKNKMQ